MSKYDLVVIGGGPGGYVAAVRGAQLGLKVALVEKNQVGGTCLNRGCIPTKAILESAKLFQKIKGADKFGITIGEPKLDYAQVIKRKNQTVTKLVKGVEYLLKKNKIDLIRGEAKIIDRGEIEITANEKTSTLTAHNIILATGSEPAQIKNFNIDERDILTSTAFLNLETLPIYIIIIGGGVMGVEFASILSAFGVKVTIIEALERILPTEDIEISQALEQSLKKAGVEIACGIPIKEIKKEGSQVVALLEDGSSFKADKALVTIGRHLNLEGLEAVGVKVVDGKVEVNEKMETNIPGIFAIGDITGKQLLAHVASAQGKVAANVAAGKDTQMKYDAVPWCIFSIPEIARVGITELEAKRLGHKVKTSKFPYRALGRAKTMGSEDGFIKVVIDEEKDQLLGVHIIGAEASELIAGMGMALNSSLSPEDIASTIFAHPTLSEGLGEAFESLFGQAIHV
ncbi:MAG: dihydrolipoyl dehydrogenase [Candidatus Margulisbacteria bacterium]|nr:dihydrolipoyl dehydrogenase [Candidatus Margulisiibacteriota bacterium]MBU1022302.1 dihydrolipoyl dehydrogenase [Candidatus Margulisiibacteriota bacterium]MBU1729915.1 dihydrolipoyl dehydrogenase [Candidatus Margulisiibacteriota bacterium]MBU1955948.1 dihydrolipoyl dehydrogenase [Candidatus Margulisiibacteriota bacterium]